MVSFLVGISPPQCSAVGWGGGVNGNGLNFVNLSEFYFYWGNFWLMFLNDFLMASGCHWKV